MSIEILKIAFSKSPDQPAYVAVNLEQSSQVCELIGTTNTIWSQEEIDVLSRRAAQGEFDMHLSGPRITLSFDHEEPPKNHASAAVSTVLAALRFYQAAGLADDPTKREGWINLIATDGGSVVSLNGKGIDSLCERLWGSQGKMSLSAVSMQTPFTGEELTMLFEVANWTMQRHNLLDLVAETMDAADHVVGELRDKLQAVMDSDVPILGQQTVVLELIENRPSATIHPTERAALDHAVRCAMENLYSTDDPEDPAARREAEEDFCNTLTDYDRIQAGDYEIHIITPAN